MKKLLIILVVIIIIIVLSIFFFKFKKTEVIPPQDPIKISTTTPQAPQKVSKTTQSPTDITKPIIELTTQDSLRGVIAVVGAMPLTDLVIKLENNQATKLKASPEIYESLTHLSALTVLVKGQNQKIDQGHYRNIFTVTSFKAISSGGVPVEDGIIIIDNKGNLLLQTDHGSLALSNPPAAFRTKIGARVFVGVPLDNPPVYGFITTP